MNDRKIIGFFMTLWEILRNTFKNFGQKRVMKLSAALAYYTVFSLPALLIIVIWIGDLFLGQRAVEGSVYNQIVDFVGTDAAMQIQNTIRNARLSNETYFATIVGVITLVIGSTSVFSEMQDSINYIWNLRARPQQGRGWVKLLLTRLLSFSMVVTLGFLLMVSLILNSLIDLFINELIKTFPDLTVYFAYAINMGLTLIITTILFGIIFRVLPDANIKWKDVKAGAFVTAILFMVGKFLIGLYLGNNRMTSAYGAAGSVVLILLWVYYSATILYLGAVFTHANAKARGRSIPPNKYAVFIREVELESTDIMRHQPMSRKVVKSPEKHD